MNKQPDIKMPYRKSNVNYGVVWTDPNEHQEMSIAESPMNDVHRKMSQVLADKITQVISKDFQSQNIINNLISNLIEDQIDQFLDEYDNLLADEIFNSFKSELVGWHPDKDKLVKFETKHPDYKHARHAKLSSFARELREKILLIKKD